MDHGVKRFTMQLCRKVDVSYLNLPVWHPVWHPLKSKTASRLGYPLRVRAANEGMQDLCWR